VSFKERPFQPPSGGTEGIFFAFNLSPVSLLTSHWKSPVVMGVEKLKHESLSLANHFLML